MKKRFLLIPVLTAFAFSLAACEKKENDIKYKDAEGNDQTLIVKATDDPVLTSKAMYAIAQAASENAEAKQKEITKFGFELSETFDAKLSDTDYVKVNLKLDAAATTEGALSASLEADLDVNMASIKALVGVSGAKGNAKANVYYDKATATTNTLPNIYFDYDVNYKLAGVDAEQKMDGKYYITNAEIMTFVQNLISSMSTLTPSVTETGAVAPIDLESMKELENQFNFETEADYKALVEEYDITISAVSANEIEFACDFKYDENKPQIKKFLEENPEIASQDIVKAMLNGGSVPFKLTINTDYFLPSRFEIDYSTIATLAMKTSMTSQASQSVANPYANAKVTSKLSVKVNYNGGTVKKLEDTTNYVEFKLSSIKLPTSTN